MATAARIAKRLAQPWSLPATKAAAARCSFNNTCVLWNQISVREIRTKAVLRRRPIPSADRPVPQETSLRTSPVVASTTTDAGSELLKRAVPTASMPTTQRALDAPVASTNKRIQRGFPTEEPVTRPKTRYLNNKPAASSLNTTGDQASKTDSSKETKPEKFPRKLEAFPFVPGATTSELAKAHKFFLLPAEFVKSATNIDMIPENTVIPEVAFIGRSNIGKSSLINGLVNRNGLVKTSSKPGHTRMMNFFKVGEKLSLVDMPGYGWKSRDEWGGMILNYLQNRRNLRRIYILVDPSHGLKESDTQIMQLLDGSGLSYQVVLTKKDRLSVTKYNAAKAEIEAQLVRDAICCFPMVLGVSSRTKDGLDELRAAIIKAGQLSL